MRCSEVIELIQRHLDQDLSNEENRKMTEHIQGCTACQDTYERMQHLSNELVNLPKVTPPFNLVDAILPKLDEMDAQTAMPTSTEHNVQASWLKRFRASHTFKAISGIAAAAIIISVIYVSLPRDFQSAEDRNNSSSADMSFSILSSNNQAVDNDAAPSMKARDQSGQLRSMHSEALYDEGAAPAEKSTDNVEANRTSEAPTAVGEPEQDMKMDGFSTESGSKQESPGRMQTGSHGQAADQAETMERWPGLASPNGEFIASLEQQEQAYQVIVTNESGQVVYRSEHIQADQIEEVVWTEDSQYLILRYTIGEDQHEVMLNLDQPSDTP